MDYNYESYPVYDQAGAFMVADEMFLPTVDSFSYQHGINDGSGSALFDSQDMGFADQAFHPYPSHYDDMRDISPANSTLSVEQSPVQEYSPVGSTASWSPWMFANSGLSPEFNHLNVHQASPSPTTSHDQLFLQTQFYLPQFPNTIPASPTTSLSPLALSPQPLLPQTIEPSYGEVAHDVPFHDPAPPSEELPLQRPYTFAVQGPQDFQAHVIPATPPPTTKKNKRRPRLSGLEAIPPIDTSPIPSSSASPLSMASPAATTDFSSNYSPSSSFPPTPSTGASSFEIIALSEGEESEPPRKKPRILVGSEKHRQATESRRTKEAKLECPICGLKITSHSNLKIHLLAHEGLKTFACPSCNKKFSTSRSSTRHESTGACVRALARAQRKRQKRKEAMLVMEKRGAVKRNGSGDSGAGPSGQGASFTS